MEAEIFYLPSEQQTFLVEQIELEEAFLHDQQPIYASPLNYEIIQ